MIVTSWEDRGFVCFINHSEMFDTFNGYMIVPKSHPWNGQNYENIPVDVHGGLTFSENINNYWVLGFDTNHHGDAYGPNANSPASLLQNYGTYRDVDYVKNELKNLVDQALKEGPGFNLQGIARQLLNVENIF